jgi:hypothetical protein
MMHNLTCRWCDTKLPKHLKGYLHPVGWTIKGIDRKYWLYITCPKCGYDWALWKLGIGRDAIIDLDEWEKVTLHY